MSMFTRRNYVWLASVCRDMIYSEDTDSERSSESDFCIKVLADALEVENNSFDKQRFFDTIYKDPTINEMHPKEYKKKYPIRA